MQTIYDIIIEMITDSYKLIIRAEEALIGSGSVEEAVKYCSCFVSYIKKLFVNADTPRLFMVDGTTLSDNLRVIGVFLVRCNEREAALEAFKLSFATLSLINPTQMSIEDKASFLYESIDGCVQDPLEEGNVELVNAIYEVAFNCPLAQDPSVRKGISQLRDQGLASLPKPSWEDDDDDSPSIVEYHEGRGNVPSTIQLETRVPFDEHAFSEGMHQALDIHDRPIIAADIDTLTDLELQGFGIRWACDLAFMPRLRFVNLASNAISDAKYIAKLREVEMLNLGNNQIADLSPFADMSSLTALDLSDNAIIDVSPLAKLANLRDLNLDNNHIPTISPLGRLEGLETLSIAGNPLSDSKGFLELTSLQLLYVSREQVEDDILTKLRERGVNILFREKPIADAN